MQVKVKRKILREMEEVGGVPCTGCQSGSVNKHVQKLLLHLRCSFSSCLLSIIMRGGRREVRKLANGWLVYRVGHPLWLVISWKKRLIPTWGKQGRVWWWSPLP
jgi:hypothetical protein